MADPVGWGGPQSYDFGGSISPEIISLLERQNYARMLSGQPPIDIPQTSDPMEFATQLYFSAGSDVALQAATASGIPREALLETVRTTNARNQAERIAGFGPIPGIVHATGRDFVDNPLGFAVKLGALGAGLSAATGAGAAAGSGGGAATTYPLAAGGPVTVSPLATGAAGTAATGTAASGGLGGLISGGMGPQAVTAAGGAGGAMAGLSWSTLVPSLVSGVTGILGANAQADAAGDAAALSERMFNTARADVLPRIQTGNAAVGVLDQVQGLTSGTPDMSRFFESPDYQFNLGEGQKAIDRSLAARGKALSGAGVKEGVRFASGMAANQYGSFVDRLLATAGLGTTGAAQSAAAGANNAAIGGNAVQNQGAARASAYGAVNDAVQGGVSNHLLQQYLNRYPVYG